MFNVNQRDMYKRVRVILFCFFSVMSVLWMSCKTSDPKMTIKGEISNLDTSFVLVSYLFSDSLVIDTVKVDNKGRFCYENSIDTFTVFTLYFNQYSSSAAVFAEKNDKLKISGDAVYPELIHVTGSDINDDLTDFKKANEGILRQRAELYQTLDREMSNGDSTANILSYDDRTARVNALNHELMHHAEEHIKEHPNQKSSLIIINDLFAHGDNPQGLQRVMGYLSKDLLSSPMAVSLNLYLEKIHRSAEGSFMPSFTLKDINNKEIKSSDLIGKYVLLSFVSVAGDESRKNIESLKDCYQQFKKDSIHFVSIYIDSDTIPVVYPKTDSIPWTVVAEKNSWMSDMVDTYNIPFIPYNILIEPKGTIRERNIAAQEVASVIANRAIKETVDKEKK